jgi:hypothetical protein
MLIFAVEHLIFDAVYGMHFLNTENGIKGRLPLPVHVLLIQSFQKVLMLNIYQIRIT